MSTSISEKPRARGVPAAPVVPQSSERLTAVDQLRGLVIVLMALDHVRDFFMKDPGSATNLAVTTPALFFTRWVTHYCAPTFIFLAGTGAFLYGTRCKSKGQLAWFLLTRGLWIIVLELTVIRFAFTFNTDWHFHMGLVFWAIGWSMIVLAGLVFLPRWAIVAFGLIVIAGHNATDKLTSADFGPLGGAWAVLHSKEFLQLLPNYKILAQPGELDPGGVMFIGAYPLIPWIGVMALGYALGSLLVQERSRRRKQVFLLGLATTAAFFVVRGTNVYGDPVPWKWQPDGVFNVIALCNCEKYPPSLSYLLMTLGPALMLLAAMDREPGWLGRRLVTFGRVPLFFYILHLYLIHGAALLYAYLLHGNAIFTWSPQNPPPDDIWVSLSTVYVLWITALLILYPPCAWYAGVKRRYRSAWLSYL
jgi:uncharacterized membrane protein